MRSRDYSSITVSDFEKLSEEEKIEWAKNYVPKKRPSHSQVALTSKKKSPQLKKSLASRKTMRRKYYSPERRTCWGKKYNERERYLKKYNAQYAENRKISNQIYLRKLRLQKYNSWVVKYHREYVGRVDELASTFKLQNSELYLKGFTIQDLKIGPFSVNTVKNLIEKEILPPPKYAGYKYSNKTSKFQSKLSNFYLVSEVISYFEIMSRYKRKFDLVATTEQELFLKKQLWTSFIKIREEFDKS